MDATRFDRWTQSLFTASSRRQAVSALLLAAIMSRLDVVEGDAGPGCKDVGKKCKNAGQCCSGVCKGKKKKKRCKAHDTGGCLAGQQETNCGGADVECTTSAGEPGACDTTTGNGGFCTFDRSCFPCTKDADCRAFCGPDAACIQCDPLCGAEGGTACAGPDLCTFP